MFTRAFTETPILSDSSSNTFAKSVSTRKDLVVDVGTLYICVSKINVLSCNHLCYSAIHAIRTSTLYTYFLIVDGTDFVL